MTLNSYFTFSGWVFREKFFPHNRLPLLVYVAAIDSASTISLA